MGRITRYLALFGVAMLVFFLTREYYRPDQLSQHVSSSILLERIRPVLKLVAVEGEFNELYTYQNAEASIDWLKQFGPFQKKAILRVSARASVGYDLEGMRFELDERTRTIRLLDLGKPQLLALEHDVDYYDLESGSFNAFTAADHTMINAQAKTLIEQKVSKSGLFEVAEEQKNSLVLALLSVVNDAGWQVEDRLSPKDGRARLNDQ